MYLNNNNNETYLLDIECDSLTPTKIWCAVILKKDTRQIWRFVNDGSASIYHDLRKFFDERKQAIWIGHNIISYDGPVLGHLCGFCWPYSNSVDSLCLSYLYNPALNGGHSLEAYGHRLGYPKGDYHDWSRYTPEMLEYCERDVLLTEKIYDALVKKMRAIGFSELSCSIEHKIRHIVDKQQQNGFWFNKVGAENLRNQLRERESSLALGIHKLFPPTLEEVGRYTRRKRKDGGDYASYERHLSEYDSVVDHEDGSYSTYNWTEFNIGSPKQRLERLLELGFQPTAKTKKGNPKVDEDSLVAFSKECGRPEVEAMAEWLVCNGRANMIDTWLNYVQPDSRIHGRVMTCGATSRRMTHNSPNSANIPSEHNGAQYGAECRALWGCTPGLGRILMGYDAKGLETAVLLDRIGRGAPRAFQKAVELLLHGDVHQLNADDLSASLGFPVVRGGGGAKTAMYSVVFGAYENRLGSIVKKGPDVGKIIKRVIYNNVPGLEEVTEWAQDNWKRNNGFIRNIDGGFVRCPTQHAALNYEIQPNGGILMKYTSILLDKRAEEKGIWHMKVADVHDEGQHELDHKDGDELGKLAVKCIEDAGEELGFKVKMTGDYKLGPNWSLTH